VAVVLTATGCSSGSGTPIAAPSSPPTGGASSGATPSGASPSGPSGAGAGGTITGTHAAIGPAQEIAAKDAATRLKAAKIGVKGAPQAALSWRDENSLNIVLVTTELTRLGTSSTSTLRVYVTAGLDQADGGRLRDQLVEAQRCDNDGGMDFVPKSMTVSDHDGDGHAEATAGWVWGCRGDPGPVGVRLALFTRGKHYQLSGVGQRRDQPLQPPFNQSVPPVTAAPAPAQAQWPAGLYEPALALFSKLYL
jgi:hypothetical protein